MVMPREKSRADWKTTQGPKTSIASAPRPMMKATGILLWAGGTSFVAGAPGGLGNCWANANAGKHTKAIENIDHLLSLPYIDEVFLRSCARVSFLCLMRCLH